MSTSDRIVESALSLFYRNGFHASGVDLLSEQAGVTKRTLYKYFPGKEELIEAALELRHRQFMTAMKTSVERAVVERRPLAYIEFLSAWVAEPGFHGCAFINAAAEYGEQGQGPHRQANAHKSEIRTYLQQLCTEAGKTDTAGALFLLGEGLIVASQVQGYDVALVDAAKRSAQALCTVSD
ncbi:transcriptional regulator, TetR family [Marinobacterium lacunae]|uniref:Transcriptional regulator, TetR family n=1 Tax=Marinobacterium lacunae TaxID=1232683 RepID=A0A081FVD4_9GAMM|nr:TetR/AcrR family transcriptional regulator [Marinobacterium lacunae]KEA62489.1 transcriptional regulator, TetR family [Marinobacterium lacunae]MBR9883506.1 TetR/AcrR family transcriptional regulator [Oceanospirillales bacterium]